MTVSTAVNLDGKLARLKTLLGRIEKEFAPAVFASSFGAEDMVLTDLIAREFSGIEIFTLDTGRLPQETEDLIEATEARYGLLVRSYTPDADAVERYVATKGRDAFYESVENRKQCCAIRKVEPLKRALKGKLAWLTGLRREQAASRQNLAESEFDEAHGISKFNPLIDWNNEEVWAYIRTNGVPYNTLHGRGYPSIGCEPCTRAVKPGEDARAGRWWWEGRQDQKECGLHMGEAAPLHASEKFAHIAIKVTI
jgi:phosphoadenosine phosphosulfate reductase